MKIKAVCVIMIVWMSGMAGLAINPETPDTNAFKLKPVIQVNLEDDERVIAGSLDNLSIGPDGSVFMLDSQKKQIIKLNSNGTIEKVFGRKGQGPGEFQRPLSMDILPDGRIVVSDNGIHFFSKDGIFIKKDVYEKSMFADHIMTTGNSSFLMTKNQFKHSDKGFFYHKIIEHVNLETKKSSVIMDISEDMNKESEDLTSFQCDADTIDRIYLNRIDRECYKIEVLNQKGETVQVIEKEYTPVKKTDAMLKEETDRINAWGRGRGATSSHTPEPLKIPVIQISAGENDSLWVRTIGTEPEDMSEYLDVFDKSGNYIARIKMEYDLSDYTVHQGFLYTIEDRDDGFFLCKYEIVK